MEPELIILKPAELFLKSRPVKKRFFKQLRNNIKQALKQGDVEFDYVILEESRLLVYTDEVQEALDVVRRVFGVSKFAPAVQVSSRMEVISAAILEQLKVAGLKKTKTFDIKTKRVYKKYPLTSVQISQEIRKYVADKTKAEIEYKKPDFTAYVELLENKAFIYTDLEKGLGGLPVGVSGKVVCLCDTSMDSMIAAWLLMRRGCEVVPLHIRTSDQRHDKFLKNVKLLEKFAFGFKLKPRWCKGDFKEEAEKEAKEQGAKGIVLSSREIKGFKAELPVFTPLSGYSTREINRFKKIIQQF